MSSEETIILRPKSIYIGISGSNCYEWTGIKSIRWNEVSPWVHIDIPGGLMVHQHIKSPHVEGEIRCIDIDSMYTALFDTVIDAYNHTAIDTTNFYTKWTCDFVVFNLVTEGKGEIQYKADNFKVEIIGPDNIELGRETEFVVRFTADRVYRL